MQTILVLNANKPLNVKNVQLLVALFVPVDSILLLMSVFLAHSIALNAVLKDYVKS